MQQQGPAHPVFKAILVLIVLVVIVVPLGLLAVAIEPTPLVGQRAPMTMVSTQAADRLWHRLDPRKMPTDRPTTVTTSVHEIDQTLQTALASIPRVAGSVRPAGGGLEFRLTGLLPVPDNPLGRYANFAVTFAPSDDGLAFSRVALGRVEIPPRVVRPILIAAIDQAIEEGKGARLLGSIRSFAVTGQQVRIALMPPVGLQEDLERAARQTADAGDPETVRVYYSALYDLARTNRSRRASLASFLQPLFALAQQRSREADPVAENRAALVALAALFGDHRFARMAGDVVTAQQKAHPPKTEPIRLNGRHDFVQHFSTSAGIAVISTTGLADVIGIGKEVKDSAKKSGFSFTDIAADRTGVRFAEMAIGSVASARRLQALVAGNRGEALFFPKTADLPEGLSEAEFHRRFGDTTSPAYVKLNTEIERRIARLPIFQ